MTVRALYESFAGNRGLFGREPSIADGMSPAQIAAYLRSDRAAPNLEFQLAMQRRPRLHESGAPPLTQGGAVDAPAASEDDDGDVDIERAILDILAGDGTDEEKAARIAALFNGDDDDDVDDDNLEESACRTRMHESAGRRLALSAGQRRFFRRAVNGAYGPHAADVTARAVKLFESAYHRSLGAPRRRAIHESAGRMVRHLRFAQRDQSARMAAVGCPMG